MKTLTLIQPWASLIVDGKKTVETRSWPTKHRGLLAIHAGKKVDSAACIEFGYSPKTIVTGSILGTCEVRDCVEFPNAKTPPDPYGDFTNGRFGWILTNVKKFVAPKAAKGLLGLWESTI